MRRWRTTTQENRVMEPPIETGGVGGEGDTWMDGWPNRSLKTTENTNASPTLSMKPTLLSWRKVEEKS